MILDLQGSAGNAAVAAFPEVSVGGAIEICARYVASEMEKASEETGLGLFSQVMKYAVIETLKVIAGGGVGFIGGKILSEAGAHVLEFAAEHLTGIVTEVGGDKLVEQAGSSDLEKRREALDEMSTSVADQTAETANQMVLHLGADDTDLGYWLGQVSLSDLARFRMPELFPEPSQDVIRASLAGIIAAEEHGHQDAAGMIYGEADETLQAFDDDVVIVRRAH